MDDVAPSDHLRADGTTDPPGVYRVVGVDERGVTLLRVGDEEGRRVHTGEVVRVAHADLAAFTPAAAPPRDRSSASALALAYWSLRAFTAELAARPLASAVGVALVVAGSVGPIPSLPAGGLIFGGGCLLAYVGGGRLRG